MSLHRRPLPPVPAETARVARLAAKRSPYLRLRDTLGPIFDDADFYAVYGHAGHPAYSPAVLALVTLLQYMENLTDRQAADAVALHLDWKYVLGLELTDPGFDHSILSEFRGRLVAAGQEALLFERVLEAVQAQGLLRVRGRQRTDSTRVLTAVSTLNRLELVGETMRYALNALATDAPTWLAAHSDPSWLDRYGPRLVAARLPKAETARDALIRQIGRDGFALLALVEAEDTPAVVRTHEAVAMLRRIWAQQFVQEEDGPRLMTGAELPPASELIRSPYDAEARWSVKRDTEWTGWSIHLTETCEADLPRIITSVQTTPATTPDRVMAEPIQQELITRGRPPGEHLLDAGYVTAAALVAGAQHGITVIGPTPLNSSWQARAKAGFAAADFIVDREREVATCPQGKTSSTWRRVHARGGKQVTQIHFRVADCTPCPMREQCTRADRRSITIQDPAEQDALMAARQAERTTTFRETYRWRAGVEATISQAVRGRGARRARYRGEAKTHLQHLLIGASLNLTRVADWLAGTTPAPTRYSAYQRLMASAASP